MADTLHERFVTATRRFPGRPAVIDAATGREFAYAELDAESRRLASVLGDHGVQVGDRIGLCLSKSLAAVASILAVLRSGAAYVPVDAASPCERNAFIFTDCRVRFVLAEDAAASRFVEHGGFAVAGEAGGGLVLLRCASGPGEPTPGLAYVLYTSGSTGTPKGVMLTHANALSFVDWCSREFQPTEDDRFSSHAPFHFDLSILDLYVPLTCGASVILLNETLGKNPSALVEALASHGITCWYSTPSILRLMLEVGRLAEAALSRLRLVLFAGEVFPIGALTALRQAVPHPIYYNLYGPTETNVCTYYRLPEAVETGRTEPYPIGWCCDNDEAFVVRADGCEASPDEEGELLIRGGTVMRGYWNLPDRTAEVFFEDAAGRRWYRTGDLVRRAPHDRNCFIYVGRRDRMVKRRGYRVELGEIEAAFHRIEGVREAAAVAAPDAEAGVRVWLFFSWKPGAGTAPSSLRLRQHAAKHLPAYMIPDAFRNVESLPMTTTDKVDYQTLTHLTRTP